MWSFFLTDEVSAMITALGIVGVLGLLLMPLYGVYFYRKIAKNQI
jgi:hypothetical protein